MMLAQTLREVLMASVPTTPRLRRCKDGRRVWRTRWKDDTAKRREKTFGFEGEATEREVKARFNLWLATWHSAERIRNPKASEFTYHATDLAHDYLALARKTFVKHGRLTSHVWEVAYAMQAFMDTFGTTPLSDVENPDVARWRDSMIHATDKQGRAYKRTAKTINGRLTILKQAFKWAREQGYVDKATLADVLAVNRLSPTRSDAKPSVAVKPVDEHWVAVAKPYMSRQVAAVVDLQWLTGMRPGEAIIMRACDIDATGDVWMYQPSEHKTEHKGKVRIIPLGPRCQAIIKPFLARPTERPLFSPREAQAERMAARRAGRKVKLWRSHAERYVANPGTDLGEQYTEQSYRRAIHYACKKAAKLSGESVPEWNPNQLRHAAATAMNRQFGVEDVSVMIGHSDLTTTRRYAQPDVQRAVEIAKKVG